MTSNQIAIQLAARLGKSIGTTRAWVKKGMPVDSLDAAIQWIETGGLNIQRPEPAAIAAVKELQVSPPLIDNHAPLAELIETYPQSVKIAVALRESGATQSKICEATGFSQKLVTRICREHPDLAPREKDLARKDWEDVRRMSLGRLKELLADDEAAKKFKAAELATVAGISSDKLRDEPGPTTSISIRAKIEAMSYDELIAAITKPVDAIEAEFNPAPPCEKLPEFKIRDIPRLVQPDGEPEENANDL